MLSKNFYQFFVWKNCPLKCKFCCVSNKAFLNEQQKIDKLQYISNEIDIISENHDDFDIGLAGGDFFPNQLNGKCKDIFLNITEKICKLIVKRKIFNFILSTSLAYEDTSDLSDVLQIFLNYNVQENITIATSFDFQYRFNELTEKYWKRNINMISKKIRTNTEIILSGAALDIIGNKGFIDNFEKTYNTRIEFIEPILPYHIDSIEEAKEKIPNFLPSRKKFLSIFDNRDSQTVDDILLRCHFTNQNKWIYDGTMLKDNTWSTNIKNINRMNYIDSNKHMRDDIVLIKKCNV